MVNEKKFRADYQARVRQAREAAGFTQAQIARVLGISAPAYSKIENRPGAVLPLHLTTAFSIMTQVDRDWLLYGEGKPPVSRFEMAEQAVRQKTGA